MGIIGMIFSLVSLVCGIIILIHAFQNAIWKGIVSIITCPLYLIYYAFAEFENPNKWLIVAGWLLFGGLGTALQVMGGIGKALTHH